MAHAMREAILASALVRALPEAQISTTSWRIMKRGFCRALSAIWELVANFTSRAGLDPGGIPPPVRFDRV
jgi:hypothetical protein